MAGVKIAGMIVFEGPDFEMTYPSFILLRQDGETPFVVLQDDERCICLFTDEHLLKQFYSFHIFESTGQTTARAQFQAARCEDRDTLLKVLDELQPALIDNGIYRIALDVTPSKRIVSVLTADFLDMLGKSP